MEAKAIAWARSYADQHSTAYQNMCLGFDRRAYGAGGVDLRQRVTVPWGSDTYPADIWGHLRGRTGGGTPPAGALVFYLPKSGHSKVYSHITIAVDGNGNTVSTSDTLNHTQVHYESISQHSNSGAYNYYAGWWLPDQG